MSLTAQRAQRCPVPLLGRFCSVTSGSQSTLGVVPSLGARFSFSRRLEIHAGSSSLRQTDGDGLLGRSGTVLSFPDVVHFLTDELARLRGWGFSFSLPLSGVFECLFFGHDYSFPRKITSSGISNSLASLRSFSVGGSSRRIRTSPLSTRSSFAT